MLLIDVLAAKATAALSRSCFSVSNVAVMNGRLMSKLIVGVPWQGLRVLARLPPLGTVGLKYFFHGALDVEVVLPVTIPVRGQVQRPCQRK